MTFELYEIYEAPGLDALFARVDAVRPSGRKRCRLYPQNHEHYPKVGLRLRADHSHVTRGVHRIVLERKLGRLLTPDEQATHSCDVKRCVNPTHLSAGTRLTNAREAYDRGRIPRVKGAIAQKAAQTHCLRGHEFTEANTYTTSRGTRMCRRCHADRQHAYKTREGR